MEDHGDFLAPNFGHLAHREGQKVLAIESVSNGDAPGLEDFQSMSPEEIRATPLEPARVKWFNKDKGFGFANVFGHGEDVFVHIEVLRASGLSDLQPGEAIAMRVIDGKRGQMAAEVSTWEAALKAVSSGKG